MSMHTANVHAVINRLTSSFIFLFILIVTLHLGTLKNSGASVVTEAEQNLLQKVLANSTIKKHVLPSRDRAEAVELRIDLSLRQIAEVDEVKQGIRVNAWFRQFWNNPLLTWNPSDYENITTLHLDKTHLWIPDTCLYNKAIVRENTDVLYRRLSTPVILGYDGNCSWYAQASLFSQCNIDVTKFPFDEQICPLTFGSWTYHDKQVNITYVQENAQTFDFIANSQWEIVKAQFKRNVNFYQGAQKHYPDVTLELRIKRLPLYHTLNLIIPCTLISLLSFITFILPTNHGERVSLVMTVLLSISVYMLIVSSVLPQSSHDIPEIGMFFLCIIAEIALSLLATCLTVKIRERQTEMPKWLDILVNNYLARLVCVDPPKNSMHYVINIGHNKSSVELSKASDLRTDRHTTLDPKSLQIQNGENLDNVGKSFPPGSHGEKMLSELGVIADNVREKNACEVRVTKWIKAAKVLDRFFLIIFLTLFLIVTLVFFT